MSSHDLSDAQRALADEADRLAAQRDALWSNLYWHTDLDAALSSAKAQRKPVLSLRLLGRLDDGLSCANSRFFRVALYANASISDLLRDRFVLHWESERPAPRVTIDFGDGRVVQTTITGNSIHYVLTPDGNIVDALPGLYTPEQFRGFLNTALASIAFSGDPLALGDRSRPIATDSRRFALHNAGIAADVPPAAELAAALAVSKVMIEAPLVEATTPWNHAINWPADDARWNLLASQYRSGARLDASSRSLLRLQKPDLTETQLEAMISNFERAMALDTARNERLLRPRLLERLAQIEFDRRNPRDALDDLNRWVYDDLFQTPASDPWLGLFRPDEIFDGLHDQTFLGGG